MIDWTTFRMHAWGSRVLNDGQWMVIDQDGSVLRSGPRWLSIGGSFESSLQVQCNGTILQVSGNPAKWLQGHNLFGSDDLPGLVRAVVERLDLLCDLQLRDECRRFLDAGKVDLSRVDCTAMVKLASRADARATARALAVGARTRHGRASVRGESVYFGEHSRRWSLVGYCKGDELDVGGKHALPERIPHRRELESYADAMFRLELRLRGMELKRRGLGRLCDWKAGTAMEQLRLAVESVEMNRVSELPSETLAKMPGRLVAVYEAWRAGHDLRGLYSKNTFYKYRKQLLEHGIDLSVMCPDAPEPVNVVPLIRTLEGQLAGVPDWAIGTELYFEPRELVVA